MATVYRTTVAFTTDDFYRITGETVDVGGETYVRSFGLSLEPMGNWHPTRQAADEIAALELEKRVGRINVLIEQLRRPLPAVAAADSSAAGRAHAEVAR
jgi:hypothetical protein